MTNHQETIRTLQAERDAALERVAVLEDAGKALQADLIMRAEIRHHAGIDNPAEKIVAAGNGAWSHFCQALAATEGPTP